MILRALSIVAYFTLTAGLYRHGLPYPGSTAIIIGALVCSKALIASLAIATIHPADAERAPPSFVKWILAGVGGLAAFGTLGSLALNHEIRLKVVSDNALTAGVFLALFFFGVIGASLVLLRLPDIRPSMQPPRSMRHQPIN